MDKRRDKHQELSFEFLELYNCMQHLLGDVLSMDLINDNHLFKKTILLFSSNLKELTYSALSLLNSSSSYGYRSLARNSIEIKTQLKHLISNSQFCESYYIYFVFLQYYQPFLDEDYLKYGYTDEEKVSIKSEIIEKSSKLYDKDFPKIDDLVSYYKNIIGMDNASNNLISRWYGVKFNNITSIIRSHSKEDSKKYKKYSSEIHLSGINLYLNNPTSDILEVQHITEIEYEVVKELYEILQECRNLAYDFIDTYIVSSN